MHTEAKSCSAGRPTLSVSAALTDPTTPARPSTQTALSGLSPGLGSTVMRVVTTPRGANEDAMGAGSPPAATPSATRPRSLFATYSANATASAKVGEGEARDTPSPSRSRATQRRVAGRAGRVTRRTGSSTASRTTSSAARPSLSNRVSHARDEERRRSQREKQASFGYVTEGYKNMVRLIEHDPLLKSGGVIPLSPPELSVGSKRTWDIQLRKWRRALHMFDYVHIDGVDAPEQRAAVLEAQRLEWVSEDFKTHAKQDRVRHPLHVLLAARSSALVPTRIPVEDGLRCMLRREDCYEPVRNVVPQSASSLTKGTDISPLEAGIKIHIAPSSGVLRRQQEQQEQHQHLQELLSQHAPSQSPATAHSPSPTRPATGAADDVHTQPAVVAHRDGEENAEVAPRSPAQRLSYGSAARTSLLPPQQPPTTSSTLSHTALPFYGPCDRRPRPTCAVPPPPPPPLCPHGHPTPMVWPTPYYPLLCPYAAAPFFMPPAMLTPPPCAYCGCAAVPAVMMAVPPYSVMGGGYAPAVPSSPCGGMATGTRGGTERRRSPHARSESRPRRRPRRGPGSATTWRAGSAPVETVSTASAQPDKPSTAGTPHVRHPTTATTVDVATEARVLEPCHERSPDTTDKTTCKTTLRMSEAKEETTTVTQEPEVSSATVI